MSRLERALKNAGVVDEFGNIQFSVRDILPDERDLLMAETAKRGASRELKRYRAKYGEIERLNERAEYYKEEMQLIEDTAGRRHQETSQPVLWPIRLENDGMAIDNAYVDLLRAFTTISMTLLLSNQKE